ncbi:MAG: hypothetical protein ACPG5B_13345 [Chitinophagales bacterium]
MPNTIIKTVCLLSLYAFLLGIAPQATAQECKDYCQLINEGDVAAQNEQYEKAINKYFAAFLDCPNKMDSAKMRINKTFEQINNLKIEAIKSEKEAEKAKIKAQRALNIAEEEKKKAKKAENEALEQKSIAEKAKNDALEQKSIAENEKLKADSLNAKNKKIIDAFYFYEGKYALAYKNNKFGFIDKEGDIMIDDRL